MTPFDMTQALITYLMTESNTNVNLQLIASRMYIQHVPTNAALPHLRLDIGDVQHQNIASQKPDFSGKIKLTLVSSISDGTQQITAIQNAIISKLDQKQLLIPPNGLLQIWLEQTHEPDVEHDRIKLSSTWQCRLIR